MRVKRQLGLSHHTNARLVRAHSFKISIFMLFSFVFLGIVKSVAEMRIE